MDQKRSNASAELESKIEKLTFYKILLHSMKQTNVTDDYLLLKQESHDSKKKTEGVMKKMEEYHYSAEQRAHQLAAQLQSVTETVNGLKRDMEAIKEKMDRIQVHELMEKMNRFMDQQHSTEKLDKKNEVDRLNQEIQQLRQEMKQTQQPIAETPAESSPTQNKVRTSEYRKLQNMLQSTRITPQRNDQLPPMGQQQPYSAYQHYYPEQQMQGYPSLPQHPMPKTARAKAGRSKTYVNPQFDFNQQATVHQNSKKNVEKTAQENMKNKENTAEKGPRFQLKRPESGELSVQHAEKEIKHKKRPSDSKAPHQSEQVTNASLPQADHNKEMRDKKDRSLLSMFQRWYS